MIYYCINFITCPHSKNNNDILLKDCQEQLLREDGVIVDNNIKRNAVTADV